MDRRTLEGRGELISRRDFTLGSAAACIAATACPATGAGLRAARAGADAVERNVAVGKVGLAVRDMGPKSAPAVFLIPGTGMQMVEWPTALIDGLRKQGRRVILFDNRDAGRSTHFTASGLPDFAALARGDTSVLPYTAKDMADDVIGVLDALKVERADLIGMSGGATLAELVALQRPGAVRSLTLVAVNSGDPSIPLPADPVRMKAAPPPKPGSPAELVDARVAMSRVLAGRGLPFDEKAARSRAEQAIARDQDPFGSIRQGMALLMLGDLRARQARIATPTTVIHGTDDPLLALKGAEEVVRAIPNARWVPIDGMGHDLPGLAVTAILAAVAGSR